MARDKANVAVIDPIHAVIAVSSFPSTSNCILRRRTTTSSFNTTPQISCSSHERPWQLFCVPTIWTRIPLRWMGSSKAPQRARQEGQGELLLHRCVRRSLVDSNERNGHGCCNGRCSLRNGRSHVRLLLALVGALHEPGALGDSDGGGTCLSWCVVVLGLL